MDDPSIGPGGVAHRGRFRVSIATMLMLVLTAAAASAFFAEVREHSGTFGSNTSIWKIDVPILATVAIASTAVALGSMKGHSLVQMMLQATLAYLGYLSLIWLGEAKMERPLLYWFQVSFALTVALPMLIRRSVKARMPRGPRRTWWKRTLEAIVFSFLNMLLIIAGMMAQLYAAEIGGSF